MQAHEVKNSILATLQSIGRISDRYIATRSLALGAAFVELSVATPHLIMTCLLLDRSLDGIPWDSGEQAEIEAEMYAFQALCDRIESDEPFDEAAALAHDAATRLKARLDRHKHLFPDVYPPLPFSDQT